MNKIFGMLGMATKAGKLLSGEFSVERAIKQRKVKLVIVAGDASDNTKKLFLDKCKYYNVKIVIYSDKKSLGKVITKKPIVAKDEELETNNRAHSAKLRIFERS